MSTEENDIVTERQKKEISLRTARFLITITKLSLDQAVDNPAIPPEHREFVRNKLKKEEDIILEPAHLLVGDADSDWFQRIDRTKWYYWPELRSFLIEGGWSLKSVQSLDQTTDRILMRFGNPRSSSYDVRGLVLGYVQSGKTSNFTATIAKAADSGYRLFIVLSGIDKGLRRQTQLRLERELMGLGTVQGADRHVRFPPQGLQWHKFTTDDLDGDFSPGTANQASLQGPEPVIMVIKKNGAVMRRLLQWLTGAPGEILREIPTLIIDDEADLASIDTRGTYQTEDDPPSADYEPPSVINSLIRDLLNRFHKKVYVAYTATPFANILIPHDTYDPNLRNDLYPKDFIVDLPKPDGYFGAEELFGLVEPESNTQYHGLDVIRTVQDNDQLVLEAGVIPTSLEDAMLQFVLSGAAKVFRGGYEQPSTMLVHTSHRIEAHINVTEQVRKKFLELRDSWRYDPDSIAPRLRELWETDLRSTIQSIYPERDVEFDSIKSYIGRFFEAVDIRTINSFTGAVLDYAREPNLKAIGIGGNKLSRGLTLEGLISSYFIRDSPAYDTLMQMGRWFGFRSDYVDLTRIWTTEKLSDRFALLAFVESRLREDIRVYEDMQITPLELGTRIWQHPSMQVTGYLKRRFAGTVQISQSYSEQLEQTFKFPFDKPQELASQEDNNVAVLERFLSGLGKAYWNENKPMWRDVDGKLVLDFLSEFRQDESPESSGCSMPLICRYIEHQQNLGELTKWTVAILSRESEDKRLGKTAWTVEGRYLWQISRSRIRHTYSLGVITSPGDEKIDLSEASIERYNEIRQTQPDIGEKRAIRRARPPEYGLLLIYPISRNSRPEVRYEGKREPLYADPSDTDAKDLLALAISFPFTSQPHPVQAYLEGTVKWRPYDEQP